MKRQFRPPAFRVLTIPDTIAMMAVAQRMDEELFHEWLATGEREINFKRWEEEREDEEE